MYIIAVNSVYFGQASQNINISASLFHLLHSYFIQYIYHNQMLCQNTVPGGSCDWLNLRLAVLWLDSFYINSDLYARWMDGPRCQTPIRPLSLSLSCSIHPSIHPSVLTLHPPLCFIAVFCLDTHCKTVLLQLHLYIFWRKQWVLFTTKDVPLWFLKCS